MPWKYGLALLKKRSAFHTCEGGTAHNIFEQSVLDAFESGLL